MSTFRLDYQFFSSSGTYGSQAAGVGYLGLATYYVGVNGGGSPTAFVDARIDYTPSGNCISLNGGAFGDLSSLPNGFCFAAGTLGQLIEKTGGSIFPGFAQQRVATGPIGEFARVKVNLNSTTRTTQINGTGTGIGPIFTGANGANIPLQYVIDLFAGPQLYLTVNNAAKWTALAFQQLRLTGSYISISWSWQIATGITTIPPAPASPSGTVLFAAGGRFAVSSGGGVNGNVNNIYSSTNLNGTGPDLFGTVGGNPYGGGSGAGISAVTFSWIDSNNAAQSSVVTFDDFEDWTWFYFWFYLPDDLPLGTLISVDLTSDAFPAIPIVGGGTGTEFSGSVKLGTIQILTTLGSGIYRLVSGKTNDTMYINNPNDATTEDFAIPDPSGKTGLIGG